jgi:hypothetical protein
MQTTAWLNNVEAKEYKQNIITGGFFDIGMRWNDYLKRCNIQKDKAEFLRSYIFKNDIKQINRGDTVSPLFEDNIVLSFTDRAWADLLAAVWSSEDTMDYNYILFLNW